MSRVDILTQTSLNGFNQVIRIFFQMNVNNILSLSFTRILHVFCFCNLLMIWIRTGITVVQLIIRRGCLQKDYLVYQAIFRIVIKTILNPFVDGWGSKLAHEDIPMIKIWVHFTIRISCISEIYTLRGGEDLKEKTVRVSWQVATAEICIFGETRFNLGNFDVIFQKLHFLTLNNKYKKKDQYCIYSYKNDNFLINKCILQQFISTYVR